LPSKLEAIIAIATGIKARRKKRLSKGQRIKTRFILNQHKNKALQAKSDRLLKAIAF
jgi:hypothetical protein